MVSLEKLQITHLQMSHRSIAKSDGKWHTFSHTCRFFHTEQVKSKVQNLTVNAKQADIKTKQTDREANSTRESAGKEPKCSSQAGGISHMA